MKKLLLIFVLLLSFTIQAQETNYVAFVSTKQCSIQKLEDTCTPTEMADVIITWDKHNSVVIINVNGFNKYYEIKESFKDELNNEIAHYLVGSINNKVVAYIGAWFILDEAHITNVAVKSDFRRQKIAKQLITAFIVLAKKHQITSITLEVRASNIPAQSLYQQFGFEKQGLRKRYYADNNEDAIIMWLRNI